MNSFVDTGILLGGFFALISVLVARENQVAIFRREWLNKTSDELEEFSLKARENLFEIVVLEEVDNAHLVTVKELSLVVTLIRSRMNVKEKLVKDMMVNMKSVVQALLEYSKVKKKLIAANENGEEVIDLEREEDVKNKIVYRAIERFEKSKYIYFKSEWVRLKEGEFFTKLSMYGCGAFVGLLVLKFILDLYS